MTVDNEDRFVERRSQYLSSDKVGLRGTTARAVAWGQLGFSASGIATKMDVTEGTVRKYLDNAEKRYPGCTMVGPGGFSDDPAGAPSPAQSECPVCLNETLVSAAEADAVYLTSGWGATAMLDNADLVCSVCHSVKVDGAWKRMQTVSDRARGLAEASSSKSYNDYREMLTRGISPGRNDGSADDNETVEFEF